MFQTTNQVRLIPGQQYIIANPNKPERQNTKLVDGVNSSKKLAFFARSAKEHLNSKRQLKPPRPGVANMSPFHPIRLGCKPKSFLMFHLKKREKHQPLCTPEKFLEYISLPSQSILSPSFLSRAQEAERRDPCPLSSPCSHSDKSRYDKSTIYQLYIPFLSGWWFEPL